MRRLVYIVCAGLAVCASMVVRLVDWGLNVLRPEPPRFRIDGDYEPVPAFATFSDPHVTRHEAGRSRLAAVRHV